MLNWHPACSKRGVNTARLGSRPLPLAFVMSSFEPGGTERQMIELIRRLDRDRWDVHVACLRARGAWLDRVVQSARCESFPVPSLKRASTLDRLRDFAAWCRDKQFAVVHAVDVLSNVFGLTGAALAHVPVRIGARRDINPGRSAAQTAAQRAAYSCAHVVVANARASAERLRFERVPARKIAVVPNGIDVETFDARALAPPLRRVVSVANLRQEKGHDVLIDAAARVVHCFPDARFDLVGDGPERERLEALVRARGLSRAVVFRGHVENVAAILEQADIFAHPSRTEAFPNALLEAMAAGLPVVASAVGGIPEIIEEGHTGLLVPAGDRQALADRISRLMADGDEGVRIGAAARRAVVARFSFDRMVAGFEHVYLEQLARQGFLSAPQALAVS
jgi:L-malate glycosyltransferase